MGKNNFAKKMQAEAERKPHYGIRKFSVGVASVLLSTSLYFGVSTLTSNNVLAATQETGQNIENIQSNSKYKSSDTEENTTDKDETKAPNDAPQLDDKKDDKNINLFSSEDQEIKKPEQIKTVENEKEVKKPGLKKQNSEIKTQTMKVKRNNSILPNELKSNLSQNSNVSLTSGTIDLNGSDLTLTLSISNYNSGDNYTLTIPKGDLYQKNAISITPLGSATGTTNVVQNNDGSYTISDNFLSSGGAAGVTQTIVIKHSVENSITEYGNIEKTIDIKKNGQEIGSQVINEDIKPTFTWGQITRTNPAQNAHAKILANQDYIYELPFTSNVKNKNITLDKLGTVDFALNVPSTFKANIERMKNLNLRLGGTITQASVGSPIIFKNISLGGGQSGSFNIVGQYVMTPPKDDVPENATTSSSTFNLYSGQKQNPEIPSWSDIVQGGEDKIPAGEIFLGKTFNAYPEHHSFSDVNYSYSETVPLHSKFDIGTGDMRSQHLINRLKINNISQNNFKKVHFICTFSDGYSVDEVEIMGFTQPNIDGKAQTIKITYQDGTSEEVSADPYDPYKVNPNKNLAKVEWIDAIDSSSFEQLNVHGKVAEKNSAGQPMKIGDKLTASINVETDPDNPEFGKLSENGQPVPDTGWSTTQTIVNNANSPYVFSVDSNQTSMIAGTANAGTFKVNVGQSLDHDDLVDPHFYVVLPQTVALNNIENYSGFLGKGIHPYPFKVTAYQKDGKTIIEYDGTGITIPANDNIMSEAISYDLRSDLPNLSSDGQVYVSAKNLNADTTKNPLVSTNEFSMLKDAVADHTYQVGKFTVSLVSSSGFNVAETAEGNENAQLILRGSSDDKGSSKMTYSTAISYMPQRGESSTLHNVVIVANLPKVNNATAFNFNLDKNGVSVVNSKDGQTLASNDYQVLYSTNLGNDNTTKTDISSYVTSDQITDWTKVKSVAIKINSLNEDEGGIRVLLSGEDPTIALDAGKISYLTGQSWADEINPLSIDKIAQQSSISVHGTSTVHVYVHIQGTDSKDDITFGDLDHTYTDNSDTMKLSDFSLEDNFNGYYKKWLDKNLPGFHLKSKTPDLVGKDSNHPLEFGSKVTSYYDGGKVIYTMIPDSVSAKLRFYDDTDHKFISACPDISDENIIPGNKPIFDTDRYSTTLSNYNFVGVNKETEPNKGNQVKGDTLKDVDYGKISQNTTFIAHFTHGIQKVTHETKKTDLPKGSTVDPSTLTKTVTEKVTYENEDGSTFAGTVPTNANQSITFNGTEYVDKTNGKLVHVKTVDGHQEIDHTNTKPVEPEWTAEDGKTSFDKVISPSETGYSIDSVSAHDDGHNVAEIPVTQESDNVAITVKYVGNEQNATIKYIDDEPNAIKKVLETGSAKGKFNQSIGFKNDPQSEITNFENQGYVLVSDTWGNNNHKYQSDDKNNFEIHFKHGTVDVNPHSKVKKDDPINPKDSRPKDKQPKYPDPSSLTHDVNRTINYVFSNKDGKNQPKLPDQVQDKLTFEDTETIDKVTGKVTKHNWDGPKDFTTITSPTISGYTPDKASVENTGIGHEHDDIIETVTYTPDQQKGKVTYIDDTTGKNIKVDSLEGKSDEKSDYTTTDKITDLENQGYVFVSDDFPKNGLTFDHDDKTDQNFKVHLKHGQITVTPDKSGKPGEPINPKDPRSDKDKAKYPKGTDKASLQVTVPREIEYLYSNGTPKAGQAIHDPHNDSITFNATKVIDKVTGKVLKTTWDSPKDFGDIKSPKIDGYTPSRSVVRDKNVKYQDGEKINKIVETVTYTPDPQKARIVYIDDEISDPTKNILHQDDKDGHTDEKVTDYSTAEEIKQLEQKGYVLVKDGYPKDGFTFDNDDTKVQTFEVHFRHGTTTTTSTKEVKRTINYVDQDGNKVADPVNDSLKFTETKTVDNVTGSVISDDWTPAQDFATITSPTVKGYTPDRTSVSDKNIDHTHADITETVTYTKDPVKKPDVKKPHKKTPTPEKKTPKPTKNTKTPKKENKYNDTFGVHGQDLNMRGRRRNHNGKSTTTAMPLSERTGQNQSGTQNGAITKNGSSAKAELPQTGESQNKLGLIGLAFASIAGFFGLAADRKRKN